TNTFAHSTSAAARKPAKAQIRTFWKKVECTPCLTATIVPVAKVFTKSLRQCDSGHGSCGFFGVMSNSAEPKSSEFDPDNLSRLLELELIQKRATWKQAGERYRSFRAIGFVFLVVLIVGCLIGGYFAFMRVSEQRANQPTTSAAER